MALTTPSRSEPEPQPGAKLASLVNGALAMELFFVSLMIAGRGGNVKEGHNMWHANRELLRSFRLVTYESLHATPLPALRSAMEAIGLDDSTAAELEAAIDFARFENLKKLEAGAAVRKAALRPKDQDDPESFKVRKGCVGGYRQSLSDDDIAFIEDALATQPCPLYQQHYAQG